jgi:dihydrofolate reductase
MRKLISFIHTSLDGFVAGPNGEMDWINVNDEIFDYAGNHTDEADMGLYGRVTYQMMEAYWPTAGEQPNASKHDKQHSGWYNKVEKVILSTTMQGVNLKNTTIISDNLSAQIGKLKQAPGKDILIFGSPTAVHSLTAENLIDDYWLFINPVLLGQGIPLFKGIKERINLKLVSSHFFSCAVVCLHYEAMQLKKNG